MALTTTLNEIRSFNPCSHGYRLLSLYLKHTGYKKVRFPVSMILDSNDITDTLWVLEKLYFTNKINKKNLHNFNVRYSCTIAEYYIKILKNTEYTYFQKQHVNALRKAIRYAKKSIDHPLGLNDPKMNQFINNIDTGSMAGDVAYRLAQVAHSGSRILYIHRISSYLDSIFYSAYYNKDNKDEIRTKINRYEINLLKKLLDEMTR